MKITVNARARAFALFAVLAAAPVGAVTLDEVRALSAIPPATTASASPIALAAPASPQVPSSVAVGRTAGSFSVSPAGAVTNTVPIWPPAGITGFAPSLAVGYLSNGADGEYGVAWSFAGLSTISRCSRT